MIEIISVSYLVAIGIFLIGLEALIFSFVLFFIGIGFLIVAVISNFYLFDNGIVQIATAFVIALVSAFVFRRKLLDKMSKPSEKIEERTHVSGIGSVDGGMIKFDGTYWNTLDDISGFKDGDKVEIVDNKVILSKSIK